MHTRSWHWDNYSLYCQDIRKEASSWHQEALLGHQEVSLGHLEISPFFSSVLLACTDGSHSIFTGYLFFLFFFSFHCHTDKLIVVLFVLPFCVFTHLAFSVSFSTPHLWLPETFLLGTLVHEHIAAFCLPVKAFWSSGGLAAASFHRLIVDSLLLFFQCLHRWVDCCFALLCHLGFLF